MCGPWAISVACWMRVAEMAAPLQRLRFRLVMRSAFRARYCPRELKRVRGKQCLKELLALLDEKVQASALRNDFLEARRKEE